MGEYKEDNTDSNKVAPEIRRMTAKEEYYRKTGLSTMNVQESVAIQRYSDLRRMFRQVYSDSPTLVGLLLSCSGVRSFNDFLTKTILNDKDETAFEKGTYCANEYRILPDKSLVRVNTGTTYNLYFGSSSSNMIIPFDTKYGTKINLIKLGDKYFVQFDRENYNKDGNLTNHSYKLMTPFESNNIIDILYANQRSVYHKHLVILMNNYRSVIEDYEKKIINIKLELKDLKY